jgi:hypothetical protein
MESVQTRGGHDRHSSYQGAALHVRRKFRSRQVTAQYVSDSESEGENKNPHTGNYGHRVCDPVSLILRMLPHPLCSSKSRVQATSCYRSKAMQ